MTAADIDDNIKRKRIRVSLEKSIEPLSRNRDPNVIQNEHAYAICSQIDNDVISGEDVDTFQYYASEHLWIIIFCCFGELYLFYGAFRQRWPLATECSLIWSCSGLCRNKLFKKK